MCSETILNKTSITISQSFHYKLQKCDSPIVLFKALNNSMKNKFVFNLFLNFKYMF